MSPERRREIEELYHAAVTDRAVLDRADPELRREVESLLAQNVRSETSGRPAAAPLTNSTLCLAAPGLCLGPYRIEARLGAGGMGEVFRATDTRLGRAVAIKICFEQFSDRFHREARALSALNHPHICTLHDVGPNYFVMELIEGETLAARLKRGKLPIERAVQYGFQIADALAAAHARGVIHRDLKPGNIMLTKSGIKVLDFGLAKSPQDETLTATRAVMGTPAYMSPEQREGKTADRRTDIYALGLVLREMATGNRQGPSDSLPPAFAHVIDRCVADDPDSRWHAVSDVRAELSWAEKQLMPAPAQPGRKRLSFVPSVLAAVAVAAALAGALWLGTRHRKRDPVWLTFGAPESTTLITGGLPNVLSPDGRRMAMAVTESDGRSALWVRSFDELEPRRVAGTEDAFNPFWSPDGQSVGFFSDGKLKKISLIGGPAQNVCTTAQGIGAAWSPSGDIVFNPTNRAALMRVPASGGKPVPLTVLDAGRQENSHRWPSFLPDGRHFLFTVRSSLKENTAIYVGSLDSKETRRILTAQSNAAYAPPGYLLYGRDGALMAQRFDANKVELAGDAVPVAGGLDQLAPSALAYFSVSADGSVLSFEAAGMAAGRLTWFDRTGNRLGFAAPAGQYSHPRISPDGTRLAAVAPELESGNRDIWLIDLERNASTRFTTNPANDWQPTWSPDGRYIAFISDRTPRSSLFRKAVDGNASEELIMAAPENGGIFQPDWSPDGLRIAYAVNPPNAQDDVWVAPLSGDRAPVPLLQTEFDEYEPKFSPDGKWLAYVSNESGAPDVYIDSLDHRARLRVSTSGGASPAWRKDGRELFYRAGNSLMAVDVKLGDRLTASAPRMLFKGCPSFLTAIERDYDVTADGKRFVLTCQGEETRKRTITIAIEWASIVKWPPGSR
jgi:Tol biopolymer transport system component